MLSLFLPRSASEFRKWACVCGSSVEDHSCVSVLEEKQKKKCVEEIGRFALGEVRMVPWYLEG